MRIPILILSAALFLGGCENTTNKDRGVLLGALAGGVIGNQIGNGRGQSLATVAGAALGGAAGSAIGARMDEQDRQMMRQARTDSLESGFTGESSGWSNPDSGNSGNVIPVRTYQNASGQYCREFQQEITIGGETEQGFGTACRQANGSWQIIGA